MSAGIEGGRPSRRGLYGVLAAHAVSLVGTRVSAIAIPWFVLVSTGSAAQTGLVAFCELAPYVVVKALTGPLVDRVGPRPVSIVADIVSAFAVGLIPLMHALDLLSLPVLLSLVAVVGAFRGPGDSAKEVFVPLVADEARVPLERATGLSGSIERLASTLGPGVAGVVVVAVGPIDALVLNALTFALGAVIIAVTVSGRPAVDEPESVQGYWHRLGEGAAFLKQDRLLRAVLGMVAFTNLLDAAMFSVLLPLWARSSGHGPAAIGAVSSTFGVCAVVGSVTAAALAHRLPRRATYLVGFMVCGAPRFIAIGLDLPLSAIMVVMGCAGLGAGFINPVIGAVFYERIPRRLLGRVNALGDAMSWAGIPFGGVVAAAAVSVLGFPPTLFVLAGAYFLATTLPGLQPAWKDMDRARARRDPVDPGAPQGHSEPRGSVLSSSVSSDGASAGSSTAAATSSSSSSSTKSSP